MKSLVYAVSLFIIGCLGPWLSFAGAQGTDTVDKRVVSANIGFGFKLFGEIVKREGNKNIFVSPTSAALALSMVYNGADGDTQQAMASALNLQGLSLEEVNLANTGLRESLENLDPQVRLSIANSLSVRQGLALKPEFVQRNKDFYNAEVSILDFTNPITPDRINQWVNDKTQGRITKIINTVRADDVLLLINTVYFKGNWQKKFDQAQEGIFTPANGRPKKHPMMSRVGAYRYFEGEKFQAVRFPYSQGRVSMVVFLPGTDSSLEDFQHSLTVKNWELWMSQFPSNTADGTVTLQRFKMEYDIDLNDSLKALGMGVTFNATRANFANMVSIVSPPVFISKVKQNTFLKVDEEGTEAAAVTSGEMYTISRERNPKTFRMVIDRPFFFAIRDDKTGTILFLGAITDPEAL